MFRFTIRDVLWLMVVVGMGICWFFERSAHRQAVAKTEQQRAALHAADLKHGQLLELYIKLKRGRSGDRQSE